MSTHLPEPLRLPWQLKPVSSASIGVETLKDGRKKFWIKHDVLKNVTPVMLAWWFGHMEGDVEIQGSGSRATACGIRWTMCTRVTSAACPMSR